MERPQFPHHPAWSLLTVDDDLREASSEWRLSAARLAGWRRSAWSLAGITVVLTFALGLSLPRAVAYGALLQENISLKQRVGEAERRVAEMDRVLHRLRYYDAQLRSLTEARGSAGGPALFGPQEEGEEVIGPEPEDFSGSHLGEILDEDLLDGPGVPVDAFGRLEGMAVSSAAQADQLLALFDGAEPEINRLLADLESVRELADAYPSLWPTDGIITSGVGWRVHPLGFGVKWHAGLDIANKTGTPIHAAASGTVIRSENNTGYGRMIEIDHGFGISTLYGHCTTLKVEKGEWIERGQFIATMGSTGYSTGPHLHFEIRFDGQAQDPLDYLPR
jgi:murein DD-endopeptidase MepM/ murein hydrolase activator NlpD